MSSPKQGIPTCQGHVQGELSLKHTEHLLNAWLAIHCQAMQCVVPGGAGFTSLQEL